MKVENIQELINKSVKIIETQTTFLKLECENEFYRIDFEKKVEFYLKKGTYGILKIENQNPLLLNYQEDFVITYINSSYENAEKLLNDLKNIINIETQNSRNWKMYFEINPVNLTLDVIKNNIKNGRGKLCEAPISITRKITEYCTKLNIKTKTFDEKIFKIKPFNILTVEDNYVIAMDFKIHK